MNCVVCTKPKRAHPNVNTMHHIHLFIHYNVHCNPTDLNSQVLIDDKHHLSRPLNTIHCCCSCCSCFFTVKMPLLLHHCPCQCPLHAHLLEWFCSILLFNILFSFENLSNLKHQNGSKSIDFISGDRNTRNQYKRRSCFQ